MKLLNYHYFIRNASLVVIVAVQLSDDTWVARIDACPSEALLSSAVQAASVHGLDLPPLVGRAVFPHLAGTYVAKNLTPAFNANGQTS